MLSSSVDTEITSANQGTVRKGDKVTIETFLDSCLDSDVESLRVTQSSGGSWASQVQRRRITKTFTSNTRVKRERYLGKLTNTGKDAFGWARIVKMCPPDTVPPACPVNTSNVCSEAQLQAWKDDSVFSWETELIDLVERYRPAGMSPLEGISDGTRIGLWVQNDAMDMPPYLSPSNAFDTTAEESALEARLASAAPGSLNYPTVFKAALEVAGCGTGPCGQLQWIRAMFAGHNLLKNVAGLMRNTAGCTSDMHQKAWVKHSPNDQTAEDICKYYIARENEDASLKVHHEVLNSKYTIWKKIYTNIGSHRPACYDNGNTIGSVYHMFAFGIVDYYSSGSALEAANIFEKLSQLKVGNNDPVYRALNDMQARIFMR